MKLDKRDLQYALYEKFDLSVDQVSPRDIDESARLAKSVDNVFGKKEECAAPDFKDVLRRVQEKKGLAKVVRPAFRWNRRAMISVAAAAIMLLLAVPMFFLKKEKLPFSLLTWEGSPAVRMNGKVAVLDGVRSVDGRISIVTRAGERVVLGVGKSRIAIRGRSRLIVEPLRKKGKKYILRNKITDGAAFFSVASGKFAQFRVDFPEGRVIVTGTEFVVKVRKRTTKIGVLHGTVKVFLGKRQSAYTLQTDSGLLINEGKGKVVPKAVKDANFSEIFISKKQPKKQPKRRTASNSSEKRREPVQETFKERIHMKDGTVISGRILSQTTDRIRVRTMFGVVDIPWRKVIRVTYVQ